MHEKRNKVRREATVVMTIDAGERKNRAGVTRNVSTCGALFQSASRFAVGEHLTVRFRGKGQSEDEQIMATGRVVRADKRPRGVPLRHVIAVQFDDTIEEMDRLRSLRAGSENDTSRPAGRS